MKYSEFLKAIQSKTIQPGITFLGEETFLKDRALEAVRKRFLDEASRAFNFRSLFAEDLKDTSFLDDAGTMPMFGEWKVLYVKDAAVLEKSLGRIKEYLEQYLEHPSPATILIFDLNGWEGCSKLKAVLSKKTAIVEFNPLSEKEIPSWVSSHLKTLQFQIDPAAVLAITERLGTDLQRISGELEKLMLLRAPEKRITLEDVELTVGYSALAKGWQWSEAILDRDAALAVQMLEELLDQEVEPLVCVGILAKQFEKMILTKEMVQQKVPHPTIAQKINKPIFFLQKYLNQLVQFSMADLMKALQVLSFADRALKTGQQSNTVLQLTIAELCHLRTPASPIFDVPLA